VCSLGVAAVVCCAGRLLRVCAVSYSLANGVEVGHRYQAARVVKWVASFVPVGVVFAADDVEEVAGGE
jgi:hypothetical protein